MPKETILLGGFEMWQEGWLKKHAMKGVDEPGDIHFE